MYALEQKRKQNIKQLCDEFGAEGLTAEALVEICGDMGGELADTSFVAMLRAELIANFARRKIVITVNQRRGGD